MERKSVIEPIGFWYGVSSHPAGCFINKATEKRNDASNFFYWKAEDSAKPFVNEGYLFVIHCYYRFCHHCTPQSVIKWRHGPNSKFGNFSHLSKIVAPAMPKLNQVWDINLWNPWTYIRHLTSLSLETCSNFYLSRIHCNRLHVLQASSVASWTNSGLINLSYWTSCCSVSSATEA